MLVEKCSNWDQDNKIGEPILAIIMFIIERKIELLSQGTRFNYWGRIELQEGIVRE